MSVCGDCEMMIELVELEGHLWCVYIYRVILHSNLYNQILQKCKKCCFLVNFSFFTSLISV